MTKCYFAPYKMFAAQMFEDNQLPDIKNDSYIHAKIDVADNVPTEDVPYVNKGMISTLLPYTRRDNYNRDRRERAFNSVVLENEYIKAVFLPELGGRLWSLFDKTENRELLYCNPVFQPANLALRNAWFSGGVEFNISIKGHNPLTCDPLFAQKLIMEDGGEGARLFEYERKRGVAYSIDAFIPEGSRFLYIRPRIENRTGKDIWMYWWSNIAVPTGEKVRVIVPAENTFTDALVNNHYFLEYIIDFPNSQGNDISYPKNTTDSLDYFYNIPDESPKWITAFDESGRGLLQCSTEELKGRKLFVWGERRGGKNWNRFLSDGSNEGYVEIQAGIARTQAQHIPMKADDTWSWVEAYGAIDIGKTAHGEICIAQDKTQQTIDSYFNGNMSKALKPYKSFKATEGELWQMGSGWGALEDYARKCENRASVSDTISFPNNSMSEAQLEWIGLHKNGFLRECDTAEEPKGYVIDEFWYNLLKNSLSSKANQNWYAYMHLGVMEYANANLNEAVECFEKSVNIKPNAWSLRNLAMIYANEYNNIEKAYEYMQKAFALNKECRALVVDTADIYYRAHRYNEWLDIYEQLGALKEVARIRLYCVQCYIALKQYEKAAEILNHNFVMPDIREGETSVSDIWITLYSAIIKKQTGITEKEELARLVDERYPLGSLDFRMH